MILESCGTVEEASYMLRHIPHAACYNYSIGDARGNMAVVEASPDQVITRAGGEAAIACVNHYEALTGKTGHPSSIPFGVNVISIAWMRNS